MGGGVIGVEIGSIYARLGSKITIIEFLDRLIPAFDKELSTSLEKELKTLGITCHFNTKAINIETNSKQTTLLTESNDGKQQRYHAEKILVAIGRRPYTESLCLDKIDVDCDEKGFIKVNETFQTSISNIYAIGDVIGGMMLAHKASEEGAVCVERMQGEHSHLNYFSIPNVVYTWPEVAAVGLTEEDLKEKERAYNKGVFPFKASGRARAAEESSGFIKILSDKETDEIIGVHMIGPRCADLIQQAVIGLDYKASAEDIARMVHPHPTYSEAIKEAALMATENRAIHL